MGRHLGSLKPAGLIILLLILKIPGICLSGDFNYLNNSKKLNSFPLTFIENRGQINDDVIYYIKGSDKALKVGKTEV